MRVIEPKLIRTGSDMLLNISLYVGQLLVYKSLVLRDHVLSTLTNDLQPVMY